MFYYYYNVCLSMLYDLNELTSRVEDFEEMFFVGCCEDVH